MKTQGVIDKSGRLLAESVLPDMPEYMRSEDVFIDGERYVRLRTVTFALSLAGSRPFAKAKDFRRRRYKFNWRGLFKPQVIVEVHEESAADYINRIFGGPREDRN